MKIVPFFHSIIPAYYSPEVVLVEFRQESETKKLHAAVHWIVDIVVTIAMACYLVYGLGGRVEVNGSSMKPVLESGDVILINRLAYDLGKPKRFDIALFSRDGSGTNLKRIIGLPGETVQIKDNRIYINGSLLETTSELSYVTIAGIAEFPVELGDDEYFLLGDNRESSEDSRFPGIGSVNRSRMIGKAWLRLQPFSRFGRITIPGGNE